ncbi:MAG: hypothetical protein GF331_09570 [Chitinivibrionales bacterium]|nr:hypothetical protein [Chitinivibrionales bacterium]
MRPVLLAVIAVVALCFAQEFLEGSGQTVPFRLEAGGSTGWDDPRATRSGPMIAPVPRSVLRVNCTGAGTVAFDVHTVAPCELQVFGLAGQRVRAWSAVGPGLCRRTCRLPPGVYVARLHGPGAEWPLARGFAVGGTR